MRPVIYMLDTNILVNWFYSRTPDFEGSPLTPWQRQYRSDIRDFCEQNENDIYIPDLVWCEFLSVILHKEMELCDDLDGFNYSKTRCRYCGREHSNAILRQYGVLCHNHPLRF